MVLLAIPICFICSFGFFYLLFQADKHQSVSLFLAGIAVLILTVVLTWHTLALIG